MTPHDSTPDHSAQAPPEEENASADRQNEMRREVTEFVKMVVWFLVLFIVLKTYVIEGYEVQGPSMEPTLKDRERILVFKLPHLLNRSGWFDWITPFDQGDIVVFRSPGDADKRFVKRVIATGPPAQANTAVADTTDGDGDYTEVEIAEGSIYVNDLLIDEFYFPNGIDMRTKTLDPLDVGPGDLFVLGDNRNVSKDSRAFGAVENDAIIGRALLRIWPLSRFGLLK